jgi:hypothetical protein
MAVENNTWIKPQLTILTRNRPEEAVLAACKNGLNNATTKGQHDGCANVPASFCRECSSVGLS